MVFSFFDKFLSMAVFRVCRRNMQKNKKKYLPKRTNYGILKYEFDIKSEKEKA